MNKLNYLIAALFAFGLVVETQAQQRCHASEYMVEKMNQDPDYALRLQQIEEHTQHYLENFDPSEQRSSAVVYTIPVVVHVVYNTSSENISDAQVQSQIDILNEDFRKMNSDVSTVIGAFSGIAADSEIEFCLASVDPSGNPTTGITRTSTSNTSFSYSGDQVKFSSSGGKDAWPRNDYLNFWVCDIAGGILGYAQFPGGPASTDGVVCDYQYTGDIGTATSPYDLGRTATHEVGHWLNLRHIWGDGGCSVDDAVSDTPVSDAPNYSCNTGHVSCGTVDNVQNYMDYVNDACMVMFSAGQSSRMRALFSPGGARNSLLSSPGCNGSTPSCDIPANPTTNVISSTTATTSWDAVSGAIGYHLQGRVPGKAWRDVNVPGTSRTFSIFKANKTYEWRVEAICASGSSGFSPIVSFTTPSSRLGETETLTLYPNPANEQLNVSFMTGEPGSINVSITDMIGRTLITETTASEDGQWSAGYDISGLENGVYFLRVESGSTLTVERFIVSH